MCRIPINVWIDNENSYLYFNYVPVYNLDCVEVGVISDSQKKIWNSHCGIELLLNTIKITDMK